MGLLRTLSCLLPQALPHTSTPANPQRPAISSPTGSQGAQTVAVTAGPWRGEGTPWLPPGVEMSLAGPGVLCQALPCLSCSPRIDCQLGPSLPSLFAANGSAAIDLRKGASQSSTSLRCLMAAETSRCWPPPPPSHLHKRPPIPLGLPPPPWLCPPPRSAPSLQAPRRKEYPLAPPRPREMTSPFLSLIQLVGGPC